MKSVKEARSILKFSMALVLSITANVCVAEDSGVTTTYRWNKSGYTDYQGSYNFTNAVDWVDGKVPFDDAQGTISLVPDSDYYAFQWLRLPQQDMTWGTVVSNIPNQFLVFVGKNCMLNITDPSGYESLWVARGAHGGLRLANDGGIVSADGTKKIPVINSFETGYTSVIATSGDTSKVEVKNLTGRGIFAKKETGELIVAR